MFPSFLKCGNCRVLIDSTLDLGKRIHISFKNALFRAGDVSQG
jgi:hypothetical protein